MTGSTDIGPQLDTRPGTAVYSSLALSLYDAWVLGISNRWAWRCSTAQVLLPFYRAHIGDLHLEVGVGTGFYPGHAGLRETQQVTLLDLNENSLAAAARRIGRRDAQRHVGDIMEPLTMLAGARYDSIALFYLLHCLPGTMADKARVFAHLKPHLAPGGVLFGATVLGDGTRHNLFGRALEHVYNRRGIFDNRRDTAEALAHALGEHFADVCVEQHGAVALFTARSPLLGVAQASAIRAAA